MGDGSVEMARALAELEGRKLEPVPREADENGPILSLMRHDAPRVGRRKRRGELIVPKAARPDDLPPIEIPDVLKGVIQ